MKNKYSKSLHVLISDQHSKKIRRASKDEKKSVGSIVREMIDERYPSHYCECGKLLDPKKDHIMCADPFEADVNGKKAIVDLCENCYQQRCDDI